MHKITADADNDWWPIRVEHISNRTSATDLNKNVHTIVSQFIAIPYVDIMLFYTIQCSYWGSQQVQQAMFQCS